MRRIGITLLLCLALLAVGFTAPAAGSAQTVARARVETLDGLEGGLRVSEATPAPFPFSMVGLDVPEGAQAELRTSVDGSAWSAWIPADVHADEGPDTGEPQKHAGTSVPVWVGEARYVQTRVSGAAPDAVAVHLVDSAGLSRSLRQRLGDALRAAWSGKPRAAVAAVDQPPIRSRAEWGADEARSGTPATARRVRNGFIHHTAQSNSYAPSDVPAILRGIQAYHLDVRDWSDMGYNLLIDRFGTVWEGRAGGLDAGVIGAHTGGFNTGSFGIAMIGDFSGAGPPAAAVDALSAFLSWKFDVHHVDATAQVNVRSGGSNRFPAGETVRLSTLSGHRDVTQTSCPGQALFNLLPALRQRIVAEHGAVLLDHAAAPTGVRVVEGQSLDGSITFSTRLRPVGAWQLEVRDPGGDVVHADAGSGEVASSTWSPAGAARGTYSYTFSSEGRRAAVDTVELTAPEVDDVEVPASVRAEEGGGTAEPVRFQARLWPDARWQITVRDADGESVFESAGTGETAEATWDGSGAQPGTYAWSITADDVAPETGELRVIRDALRRLATTGDPVADAVELSGAAFDDGAAQHAVLARADVFADTMAGGPLAGEDGPVLLTGSAALDARAEAELRRLLAESGTVYVLGGEEAFAPAVADTLAATWDVVRIGGAERTETAALVAAEVVARSGVSTALVARGSGGFAPWADALAGGAYGAEQGIPVLLTDTAVLSPAAAEAIQELGITDTIVLGGIEAVGEAVAQQLPLHRRVGGVDRAATAAAIARELWGVAEGSDGDRLLLAGAYREDAWTLALAATSLAARNDAPLYAANAEALPASTADALRALGYGPGRRASGWVLGGDAQVSPATAEAASNLLG